MSVLGIERSVIREPLLVATFTNACGAHAVANATPIDPANGEHAIMTANTPVASSLRRTRRGHIHCDSVERPLSLGAAGGLKLWRVEIRNPDFYPATGIGIPTDAKSVAVDDISNLAGEGFAGSLGKRGGARVCKGGARCEQR